MSLQDDFFDIDSALDGTAHHEAFIRIWEHMCRMEAAAGKMEAALAAMETGAGVRREIESGAWRNWFEDRS